MSLPAHGMADWGRRWLPPILFGCFLYGLIVAYAPPAVAYNAWVGQTLYLGSALLLFWSGGAVGPWHWDRQVGWALLGFGALVLIATWGSPKIYLAWPRLMLYGGVMLWGFAVYWLHRDDRYGSAEGTLLAMGVVHALVTAAMFAWIHAMQGGHYDSQTVPPYHSNIRHPGYLGYVCAISGIGIAMSRRRLQLSAWLLATIALLEIITLGTRGAFYAWGLGVLMLVVVRRQGRWPLMVAALASVAVASTITLALADAGVLFGSNIFVRTAGSGEALYTTSGRWAMWQDAFAAIVRHPWLGYGPEGYLTSACCDGSQRGYLKFAIQPHSVLLLWLLEFGALGTVALGWLASRVIRAVTGGNAPWWRWLRNDDLFQWLSISLLGLFAYGLIDGVFYHAIPLTLAATLVGLWAARVHALAAVRVTEPSADSEPAHAPEPGVGMG